MEGGFGFPIGGDPEDLMRGLREFAERQAESVAEAQREQFATLTLNTAVQLTAAALTQIKVEGASDEQASAIERILSGQEGGPFGDFAGLIGDYTGMERGRIAVSDGSVSVGEKAEYTFEPFTGPTGQPTTVSSAMFGFAPTYTVGKGSGRAEALGQSFEPKYGESADFEYSSEAVGEIHPRA
jgi:hypothetical protein